MPESQSRSFVTCRVDNLDIGIDLTRVREILLDTHSTHVCGAKEGIDGLVNLRGELVTVLDLGTILQDPSQSDSESGNRGRSRTIIIECHDESIGLIVDSVGDVLVCDHNRLEPVPGNLQHASEDRFFEGVVQSEERVFVILDLVATVELSEVPTAGANTAIAVNSTNSAL